MELSYTPENSHLLFLSQHDFKVRWFKDSERHVYTDGPQVFASNALLLTKKEFSFMYVTYTLLGGKCHLL